MQVDGRNGGFIPMGVKEKADDVPAMLSKDEFVMTADAVRGMGNGDVNAGAQKMYDLMNSLEASIMNDLKIRSYKITRRWRYFK